jgi:tetratricopeptide (TPR) repeat protein
MQAALPLLRRITEATRGSDDEFATAGVLAAVLRYVDPEAAERQLRDLLNRAVAQQRFDFAIASAGTLVELLWRSGRLEEALTVADQKEDLSRRAGFGPWTQLQNRVQRLLVLGAMGRDKEVLDAIHKLGDQMAMLPEQSEQRELAMPWNAREFLFGTGREAALHLGRWQEALAFTAELVRSRQARGATKLEVARARFPDYGPLLSLGEPAKAERLLLACRELFEAERDFASLGKTLSALAEVEANRGHPREAIRLEQSALRYKYAVMDPEAIAISHHNLANNLGRAGDDPAVVLAHRLAAAYVFDQTGSGRLPTVLHALANDLAAAGDQPPLPGSFAELCTRAGEVMGVRLADLATGLPRRQASHDQALTEIVQAARTMREIREQLKQLAPVIDAVVAAARGGRQASADLEPVLAEQAKNPQSAALTPVLRRIVAGERGKDLVQGLGPIDTAIITHTLQRLAGQG